jgi:putative ABC transport system permease protein
MHLKENMQLALEGLKANKMRALLTMLGIIIGISSVITIMTIGQSMTAFVSDTMQGMGTNNISLRLQNKESDSSARLAESDLITDEMLEIYRAMYANQIQAVSLSKSGGSGKAQDGRKYANVSMLGVNDEYIKANSLELISGRFIREADVKSNRYTAVVSDRLAANMFDKGANPLGGEIRVSFGDNLQIFTIVGVYKYEESSFAIGMGSGVSEQDVRTSLFVPLSTYSVLTSADRGYQSVTVMAAANVDTEKMAKQTEDFFNAYYANNTVYEVRAISMESAMSSATSIMGALSLAVAVIAAISLIVGGVGVMNIMLVSVTERTREIGPRKALGARSAAIRLQFIVEAIIICCLGGFIGIAAGMGLGYLGSVILGFPAFPSPFIVIVAFMFSALIGVFFGYYPANKAALLDPIEALRYE